MLAYFNINSVSRDGDWKGLTLGSLKVAILPQNIEGLMTLSDQKLHAIMAFCAAAARALRYLRLPGPNLGNSFVSFGGIR